MLVDSGIARRIATAAVCGLSLLVCCGLAWWQWERFASGGSFQNLGYVLQWPLFGLFPAFVVWRIRKLRARAARPEAATASDSPPENDSPGAPAPDRRPVPWHSAQAVRMRAHAQGVPPDDEDPGDAELAAYNRYLAGLYARDE